MWKGNVGNETGTSHTSKRRKKYVSCYGLRVGCEPAGACGRGVRASIDASMFAGALCSVNTSGDLRSTDSIEILDPDQHLAGTSATLRWGKHAGLLELVDDARRATVADLEAALEQRRRTLSMLDDHLRSLTEAGVPITGTVAGIIVVAA